MGLAMVVLVEVIEYVGVVVSDVDEVNDNVDVNRISLKANCTALSKLGCRSASAIKNLR